MKLQSIALIFLAALFLGLETGHAADSRAPVNIEADRMESSRSRESIAFIGHVEARQEDLVIRADEMTVHYLTAGDKKSQAGKASQSIKKIVARGNVEISKGGWVASGDALDYLAGERRVLLTGNTKVWQNNNMVTGDRIILYLDEGKSVVEKSRDQPGRVKAFLFPGGAGKPAEPQNGK